MIGCRVRARIARSTRSTWCRRAGLLVTAALVTTGLSAGHASSAPSRATTQEPHLATPAVIAALRTVADAWISPDGSQVAYVVGGEPTASGTRSSRIWLVSTSGGEPRPLSQAAGDESEPRWSPDGRRLAYLADRGKGVQIYVAAPDGAGETPAADNTTGASRLTWSPDGRYISFLRRPQVARAPKAAPDAPIVSTADFGSNALWVVDVASRQGRQVSGKVLLSSRVYTWSPDSTRVAVIAEPAGGLPTANERETLVILSLAGSDPRTLANLHDRTIALAWSPDGRAIGWCGREHTPKSGQLMVFDPTASQLDPGRTIAADFRGSLQWIGFLPDGHLAFAALVGLRAGLYSIATDGTGLTTVLSPEASKPGSLGSGAWGRFVISLTADGRHLATIRSGPAEPGNVVAGEWGKPLKRLTNLNPDVEALTLGATEDVTWKAKDGTQIGGLLVKPVGYQPGRRYPMVVELHGGPRRSWWDTCGLTEGWAQMLAARGYLVLLPNPRGSEGYGAAFIQQAGRDLGGVDFQDVMAGVDAAIARGDVDPGRLGVGGWSYGGYLTAWTITQTTRFKAAVVGAGITNWISHAGLSGLAFNMSTYVWQQPLIMYEDPQRLIARSPITFAKQVRTPTLVLHGDRDTTVPTEQGTEFYVALRMLGVPVEQVLYPNEAHVFNRPAHQIDVLTRVAAWFDRYLKPGPGTSD